MARKMKLPNGFGQISKIKNKKLRKPYRAMVTVGKTDTGRPIVKILKPQGYFETYNDAYTALLLYSKNPYDFSHELTLKELYDKWFPEYSATLSDSRKKSMDIAWRYCSKICDLTPRNIKSADVKACMDNGEIEYRGKIIHPTDTGKVQIKILLGLLLDYAIEYDLTDRNVARTIKSPKNVNEVKNPHKSFTKEEMKYLWNNNSDQKVQMILGYMH